MGSLFVFHVVVVICFLLVLRAAAEEFELIEISLPQLTESHVDISIASPDAIKDFLNNMSGRLQLSPGEQQIFGLKLLDLFRGKRVVWVLGEFKVGKTFLIDILTKAKRPRNDSINNTIGLNIYVSDDIVIVDSEGMNQPAGTNNPYFVKEFIMNLMELTADEVVLVSDQMKLTDMEVYRRIARMYYNTKMSNFYYFHNCKTLTVDKLVPYKERVRSLLSLDRNLVDMNESVKPIEHLFYPAIPLAPDDGDNLVMAMLKSGGRVAHDFIQQKFGLASGTIADLSTLLKPHGPRRNTLSSITYSQAVEQSLRYMGIDFQAQNIDEGKWKLSQNRKYIVEYSPPWLVYCMADSSSMVMKLRTGEFQSYERIENGKALRLRYMSYTPDYLRFEREHRVVLPIVSLSDTQSNQPWRAFRHPDGVSSIMIPVPDGEGNVDGIPACPNHDFGQEINARHDGIRFGIIANIMDYIELFYRKFRLYIEMFQFVFVNSVAFGLLKRWQLIFAMPEIVQKSHHKQE